MTARKISLRLHLWVGLFAAIFLFIEGLTGGIMAWGPELYRMLDAPKDAGNSPPYHVVPRPDTLPLTGLVAVVEKTHPGFRLSRIQFPARPDLAWSADLQSPSLTSLMVWFDPHTGETLGQQSPSSRFGWLVRIVQLARRLHGNIVGGVALFLLAASGLILWWPRKIFAPRRLASGPQINFDLHATIGFYSSLVLMVFSGTAMVMSSSRMFIAIIGFIMHTPLAHSGTAGAVRSDSNRRPRLASPLDLDQALKEAGRVLPGAIFTEMRLLNDGNKVVEFSYRLAEPSLPRSGYILVNPVTGGIQQLSDPQSLSLPERIVRYWVPRIHQGELYGRVSLWIAGFFSFMLAVLAATGPAIWWLRRRADRATPSPLTN
jgi:uncharacterized iron-regulated membrane protein